jgi:hypothetical protein
LLREGKNVDLVGASTALDFDLETGDLKADIVVDCVRWLERANRYEAIELPLVYHVASERYDGALACP